MTVLRLLGVLIFAFLVPGLAPAAEIFGQSTSWKYLKGTTEASLPPTAWRLAGFNDAVWLTGSAPFYYERSSGYSGNTDLSDMPNNYSCIFMRKTFAIANPAGVQDLTLDVRSDDGCIVWINGQRVLLLGMPDAEPVFNDFALNANDEPKTSTISIPNPSTVLRSGENVVAIQAFNQSHTSSDFLIAASLSTTVDTIPPTAEVVPPPGAVRRQLTQIEVLFSEAVVGVNASDLTINGLSATGLSAPSPVDYIFTFAQPANGTVQVAWANGPGITDTSPAMNPFAGGSWQYTLDPTAPEASLIISEFMADNQSLNIKDDDGKRSDWIEILNLGPVAANLSGWYLTDSAGDLTQWRFPVVTLGVNQYLVVWASGEDRTDPTKELHTNFKLGAGGEYLALVDPNTNIISDFTENNGEYPPQPEDVSYGRVQGDPTVKGYFSTPTPGGPNATSGPGFAPDPVFSVPGGFYASASVSVTLSAPSGTIRYTLDGSTPTSGSAVYGSPLTLANSTVVKARVFQTGWLPSSIGVQTYELIGTGLSGFTSKLPLMIINTHGKGIAQEARTTASIVTIEPFRGDNSLQRPAEFQGLCQIERRGQTSAGFAKGQYSVEIDDAFGNDMEVPLLGLPKESDWVINGPYSDKTLMNNFLAFELHEKMGHYSVRRKYVEVFLDTGGGKLNYPGDYAGVYVLLEKIKIDNNRVDLARLTPAHNAEPEISGGYIFKKDKDSPGDRGWTTSHGQYLKYHDPKPEEITPAQETWLQNYINQFESAMYASDWLTRTGPNHYSNYIDVDSFVDAHWIVEFAKQIDGYRLSDYMHKDRNGKINMSPIWDWNLSFGNADYLDGGHFSGWYYPQIGETEHIWLRRLISNPGDPDFNQKIIDRWSVLRTNILAASNVLARVDEIYDLLKEAAQRDISRYSGWNQYRWPNPTGGSWDVNYATPGSYDNLINGPQGLKHWIAGRCNWIDSQFPKSPEFSSYGGSVLPGFAVSMTAPSGTIYYTTDGTDPRAPGGAIASGALTGSSVIINANARVVARARVGAVWSGPTAATFVTQTPPLVLTELMYHPAPPPAGSTNDVGDFEFIELKNTGTTTLSLSGFQFIDGIQFNFSTGTVTTLNPGSTVLLVKNRAAFTGRYGVVPNIAGEYAGNLRDSGERLTLIGPMLETVFSLSFKDGWYPATDGLGFALVPADLNQSAEVWSEAIGWRTGSVLNGTPGQPEPPPPAIPPILVNEALTHTDLPNVDSIELYNPNPTNVDISGWFLSDDFREPKYEIPAGTIIPAQGYFVFDEHDFNPTPGTNHSFNLRSSGDEAYLYSSDGAGHLTGYIHGFDFGASLNGVSFGRHVISTGKEHFVAQSSGTLSNANAGPKVGPVVISEIMYRPKDVFRNNAYWDDTEHEFIELYNITSTSIPLYDPNAPTNTWRLRDAVDYSFPLNESMAPGERLLVVNFDPVADPTAANDFRSTYGISPSIRLFGPYGGKLNNSSDSVELIQPDVVRFYTNEIVITAVLIDKVAYDDLSPWPLAADGSSFSLQRKNNSAYGNDPANWLAAAPTPGVPYVPGSAPIILVQPASQVTLANQSVTFYRVGRGHGTVPIPMAPQRHAHPGSHFIDAYGAQRAGCGCGHLSGVGVERLRRGFQRSGHAERRHPGHHHQSTATGESPARRASGAFHRGKQ